MNFREKYSPIPVAVNGTAVTTGVQLGAFMATTAGTITITSDGVTLLSAHPVSAGQYLPLPIALRTNGATVTLAGGASGLLLV